MLRFVILHFLVFFAMVGVLVTLAFLQHEYGHDFRHHPAAAVTSSPTVPSARGSSPAVDPVQLYLLKKLASGELSCVNGYVSALRMEKGEAKAYVIPTSKGPVHCTTWSREGRRTSL